MANAILRISGLQDCGSVLCKCIMFDIMLLHHVNTVSISLAYIQMLHKTANLHVKKLTSLNLVLRATIMTPAKPQISKLQAEKSCQVGFNVFNVLQRLYSHARAFV
jgi:hypothetical protein